MDIWVVLAVIVIILLGAIAMSIARLAASVSAIGMAALAISREVQETAQAIRDHANGPDGISQQTLNDLADNLDRSAASFNDAASQLDSLQSDLGGTSGSNDAAGNDGAADEPPLGGEPVDASGAFGGDALGDVPVSDAAGEADSPSLTGGDAGGLGSDATAGAGTDATDGSGFGNQNGIGSDMEQGAGGGTIDLNSQSGDGTPQAGSESAVDGDAPPADVADGDRNSESI